MAEAVEAGLEDERLRRTDVERLGRRLYAVAGVEHGPLVIAKAVCRMFPNTWVSHGTGGQQWGLKLPESIDLSKPHVTRLRPANLPRSKVVKGHHAPVRAGEVVRIDKIPFSTPARVWLELAGTLTVRELIELGDHLVRLPRPAFENRSEPHATIARLGELLEWHPRIAGAENAAEALKRIRVGADSIKETHLRLAMVDAGLPEPELQVVLDASDKHSPVSDLGYRDGRLAIDYDGNEHLTPEQQARDIQRHRRFVTAGWRHITANRHDAREGFKTFIAQIGHLLTHPWG